MSILYFSTRTHFLGSFRVFPDKLFRNSGERCMGNRNRFQSSVCSNRVKNGAHLIPSTLRKTPWTSYCFSRIKSATFLRFDTLTLPNMSNASYKVLILDTLRSSLLDLIEIHCLSKNCTCFQQGSDE